jgi:hypothetical protein
MAEGMRTGRLFRKYQRLDNPERGKNKNNKLEAFNF